MLPIFPAISSAPAISLSGGEDLIGKTNAVSLLAINDVPGTAKLHGFGHSHFAG